MAVKNTKKPAVKKPVAKKTVAKKTVAKKTTSSSKFIIPPELKGLSAVELIQKMVERQIQENHAAKYMMELFVRPGVKVSEKLWEIRFPKTWSLYSLKVRELFEAVNNNPDALYLNAALKRVFGYVGKNYGEALRSDDPILKTAASIAGPDMHLLKKAKDLYLD